MNRIATLVEYKRFEYVTVYTIQFVGDQLNELQKFVKESHKKKRSRIECGWILAWIKYIGTDHGGADDPDLFRNEDWAIALPPPVESIKSGKFKEIGVAGKLRLYGYWPSVSVLIFFNGGWKKTRKAQDCPNVGKHFRNAQKYVHGMESVKIRHSFGEITNLDDMFFEIDVEE